MSKEKEKMLDWYRIITLMEKSLLVVIAFLTAYAVIVEMFVVLHDFDSSVVMFHPLGTSTLRRGAFPLTVIAFSLKCLRCVHKQTLL